MPGVKIEDVGGLGIEDEADWPPLCLLLVPHLTRDKVTVLELVDESLTLVVKQKSTFTTERYKRVSGTT